MIKTSAAALLLTTALATGAFAQATTNTTPAPSTDSPAVNATAGAGAAATSGSTQFLTQQDQGQYRASKFVGLAIYGQDDQRIGDVNEILIDGSGTAKAIVIGVGGFLGIGEKNVAVPFPAVQWVNERPSNASASNAGSGSGTGNTAGMNTNPPAGTSASAGLGTAGTAGGTMGTGTGTTASRDTSVTGSTAGMAPRSAAETAASNGYPDHGKVHMSKADLQNAPTFKYVSETRSNAAAPAAGGTAPRQ